MFNHIHITFKNLIAWLFDSSFAKAIIAVWFYFGGVHTYLLAIIILLLLDVVTGMAASFKKGRPFDSRILRKGLLEKLALYLVLIVAVFFLDNMTQGVFGHQTHFFAFVITFLISTYEVTSICENLITINPNLPFLNGLVRIFKKMGESTVERLEGRVDDITDEIVGSPKKTTKTDDQQRS